MKQISNHGIGTRLFLAFAVVLLLLVVIAGVGWSALSKSKAQMEIIISENNAKIAHADAVRYQLNNIARAMRDMILRETPAERAQEKQRIVASRADYAAQNKSLTDLLKTDTEKRIHAELLAGIVTARAEFNKVIEMAEAGQPKEAAVHLRDKAQVLQDKIFVSIDELLALLEKQNAESVASLNVEYERAKWVLASTATLAVLLGLVFAWRVTRSIVQPIGEAVTLAQRIAANDLTGTVSVKSRDETGVLMQALQDMQSSLTAVVEGVRRSSDSVANASSEIAMGNHDLSARTERQASALEETAASIEQLSTTVKQNAENAVQANQLAIHASGVAAEGGEVVARVVSTMKDINESSKKIYDIISVIDSIAFQTNILALNAAVEAARAGEQGRGFAVVASEVRTLASRSAQAAKEIKGLIGASVERVEQGATLAEHAGSTMTRVVDSIQRVTSVVAEISAASSEQSSGVSQVGEAVVQMDQVTQQNAALVEEMAAAASSLQRQAQDMVEAVAVFHLPTTPRLTA